MDKDFTKKAKNAMYIVAVINVLTAVMFYIAYNSSKQTGFLIAVIVNLFSSVAIVVLANFFMNPKKK